MSEITSAWLQFLLGQGASLSTHPVPQVDHFDAKPVNPEPVSDFVAPLTDLGMIAWSGDEAAQFLHSQLTNDVEHLASAQARLAGYCSPKGRLLATLLMWRTADTIILQLPREIQPAVQKRLQMYVLRAKAKPSDGGERQVLLGLAGPAAAAALTAWFPAMPGTPYAKVDGAAGTLIRMADAGTVARYQWVTTLQIAQDAWPALRATLRALGPHAWRLTEIAAGIPHITQATQDQFVPQMLNYEAIGGVNFKKGCYPGQEIVARSQYLGKLKRRMVPASIAVSEARPGMEVFSAADPAQPCGMIVNAERAAPDRVECLVEIKVAALDAGAVHLGAADGPALHFKPLPYALTDPT